MTRHHRTVLLAFLTAAGLGWLLHTTRLTAQGRLTPQELNQAFPADSRTTLEQADKLIVYAITPTAKPDPKGLHGYKILQSKEVAAADVKKQVISSVYDAIADHAERARCFVPHHAIRAVKGTQSTDLILCFHCHIMVVYAPGAQQPGSAAISSRPEKLLNQLLK